MMTVNELMRGEVAKASCVIVQKSGRSNVISIRQNVDNTGKKQSLTTHILIGPDYILAPSGV